MAGLFGGTPDPHIVVVSIAKTIAVALNSQLESHYLSCAYTSERGSQYASGARGVLPCSPACSLGRTLRALKRGFATLHDEEYMVERCLHDSNESYRREFQRQLNEVATHVDSVIDGEYVGSICPQNYIGNLHIRQLYYILQERPKDFEESRVLCSSRVDKCSRILPSLLWISKFIDAAALSDSGLSPTVSIPPVSLQLHQGSGAVRELATRLHKSLHQGWPCQSEHDEGHEGKLGECTRANIRLDPRWLRNGVKDETFFVVLSVDDTTYQECEIHLDMPRQVGVRIQLNCHALLTVHQICRAW